MVVCSQSALYLGIDSDLRRDCCSTTSTSPLDPWLSASSLFPEDCPEEVSHPPMPPLDLLPHLPLPLLLLLLLLSALSSGFWEYRKAECTTKYAPMTNVRLMENSKKTNDA